MTIDATAFQHPATYTVDNPHNWHAADKMDFIHHDSAFGTTAIPHNFKIIAAGCEYSFNKTEFGVQYWYDCNGALVDDTDPDYAMFAAACPGGVLNDAGDWHVGTAYTTCDIVGHGSGMWVPRVNHTSSPTDKPITGANWEQYWVRVSGAPMSITVRTATANDEVYLPFVNTGTYDVTIDWGDGTPVVTETAYNGPNSKHIYATAGDHTITITGTATQN